MKIWVIGRNYPTNENNMQGSFELEQAKMLGKGGNNQVFYLALIFHPFKKIKKWGYVTWKEDGITICAYSQFYLPNRIKIHWKLFQEKKWNQFLQLVENQFGIPDIIHVHYPSMITEPNAVLRYQGKGAKIAFTEHWTHVLENSLDSYESNRLFTYMEHADIPICVGQPLESALHRITGTSREIYIVPDVVSSQFQPLDSQKMSDKYKFIAVGRLQPHKQFDGVIRAFADKFAGRGKYVLIIIGNGPEKGNLQKLAEELNVKDQVLFTGTLSRNDVSRNIASADCLVCFSRLETFGVPVIEAWASGIPVIASNSLGFLEYFQDSLGYIVRHDSISDLGEAMENVVENRDNYFKNSIAEFAKSHFGEDVIYQRLMELYCAKEMQHKQETDVSDNVIS